MGTRHFVQVRKKGCLYINQYGQFDGYVDYAGVVIRDFIAEHSEFLREIDKYVVPELEAADVDALQWKECMLGCTIDEAYTAYASTKMKQEAYGALPDDKLRAFVEAIMDRIGYDAAVRILVSTRDTGYMILNVLHFLYNVNNTPVKVALSGELDFSEGVKGMIHSIFRIDVDEETFTVVTGEGSRTWSFDNLPTDEELKALEDME